MSSIADDENVQAYFSFFFYDDDEIILDAAWGKEQFIDNVSRCLQSK